MIDLTTTIAATLLAMQAQAADTAEAADAKAEATAQAAEQVEEVAEVDEDKDKIICKRTAVIGSKFKKKICGTKEQWATMHNRGEDSTREMQRRRGFEPAN